MIIQEEDFRLTPLGFRDFDLELLYTIKPKSGETRTEFKNAAYGVSLEHAMKLIINYRIQKKVRDRAITMKQYLQLYKRELNFINNLIKACTSETLDSEEILTDSSETLTTTAGSTAEVVAS